VPLLCGEGPASKRREAAGRYVRGSEDSLNLTNESESRYSRWWPPRYGRYGKETFGDSTDGAVCGSLEVVRFDADGAILAAQCDGLNSEVQLNGWGLSHHWRVR